MKEKTFLSKRAWLNPKNHSDTGMFATHVSVDDIMIAASLDVWDCSRKIELDFSVWNEQDVKQRAHKLSMLITALEEMRASMGEAYMYWLDNKDDEDE